MRGTRAARAVLLAAVVAGFAVAATAAPPTATQTVRWLRQEQSDFAGSFLISYSALSWRGRDWDLRGSVSWLSWRETVSDSPGTSGSGFGALYVTVGRRVWGDERSWRSRSRGWVRLRGKLPLQDDYAQTGSGKSDWGASLLTSNRYRELYVLAEAGILKLGEPLGVDYEGLFSGSVSLSYHRFGATAFPVFSFSASTPARREEPAYLEWSGGFGIVWSHDLSTSLLYSRGLTEVSPAEGLATVVSVRF